MHKTHYLILQKDGNPLPHKPKWSHTVCVIVPILSFGSWGSGRQEILIFWLDDTFHLSLNYILRVRVAVDDGNEGKGHFSNLEMLLTGHMYNIFPCRSYILCLLWKFLFPVTFYTPSRTLMEKWGSSIYIQQQKDEWCKLDGTVMENCYSSPELPSSGLSHGKYNSG